MIYNKNMKTNANWSESTFSWMLSVSCLHHENHLKTHFLQSLSESRWMSVRDRSNWHFAQCGVCAAESKAHAISPCRAYFQRTLQMVFETLQVKNDTQSVGYGVSESSLLTHSWIWNLCTICPHWSVNNVGRRGMHVLQCNDLMLSFICTLFNLLFEGDL